MSEPPCEPKTDVSRLDDKLIRASEDPAATSTAVTGDSRRGASGLRVGMTDHVGGGIEEDPYPKREFLRSPCDYAPFFGVNVRYKLYLDSELPNYSPIIQYFLV